MKHIVLFIFALLIFTSFSACTKNYQSAEAASICDEANDKKDIQLSGYLTDGVTVMCSNYGGRMDCGFDLIQVPGEKDGISVNILQGNSSNEVEKLERGYKKEDIKIRDDKGDLIAPSDKVKVSGTMSVGPKSKDGQACFMTVDKIEK